VFEVIDKTFFSIYVN